jgi:hypothetical protein
MNEGLNRNDMRWITRDCKSRASVQQMFDIIREYQDEIEIRFNGREIENDTEDSNQ